MRSIILYRQPYLFVNGIIQMTDSQIDDAGNIIISDARDDNFIAVNNLGKIKCYKTSVYAYNLNNGLYIVETDSMRINIYSFYMHELIISYNGYISNICPPYIEIADNMIINTDTLEPVYTYNKVHEASKWRMAHCDDTQILFKISNASPRLEYILYNLKSQNYRKFKNNEIVFINSDKSLTVLVMYDTYYKFVCYNGTEFCELPHIANDSTFLRIKIIDNAIISAKSLTFADNEKCTNYKIEDAGDNIYYIKSLGKNTKESYSAPD